MQISEQIAGKSARIQAANLRELFEAEKREIEIQQQGFIIWGAAAGILMILLVLALTVYHQRNTSKIAGIIAEKNTALENLAITDPLTQVYNRRKLYEEIEREYARFQRSNQLFAIALLDIDHFKRVNDELGHDFGDHVLKEIAKVSKMLCRKQDTLARWGEEEFMVLLPDTSQKSASMLAERLRVLIGQQYHNLGPRHTTCTTTIGVAEIKPDQSIEDLVKSADKALYKGKEAGRNQVVLA